MKKFLLLGSLLLSLTSLAPADPVSAPLVLFKRETFESMVWDEGRVDMGKQSVMGTLQGLGAAGDSLIVYEVGEGEWDMLESLVGYLKSAPSGRSCTFEVQADGATIYTSESIKSGEEPDLIKVPIKGHKMIVLRIHPEKYGSTGGAAWGNPRLIKGLKPEDLVPPLTVEVNGKRTQVLQPGGKPPREHFIAIPLNPGTTEYRVKVVVDKANNKATITSEPVTPTP